GAGFGGVRARSDDGWERLSTCRAGRARPTTLPQYQRPQRSASAMPTAPGVTAVFWKGAIF
ncbi:hypothetical protein, partial [Rothia nasimurium]|uniref:hypothetical protein n=1 Tax=Rothia nasimurium TaxID=85336 RepID=UPI001F363F71